MAFDPTTAAGEEQITEDLSVRVTHLPDGCVESAGGASHGVFQVQAMRRDTPIETRCADRGETTEVQGVVVVFGTTGADVLTGAALPSGKPTVIFGFEGDDVITLAAGAGETSVYGGAGNDLLTGGAERDLLVGGMGDDTLTGGASADEMYGGPGGDTLEACPPDTVYDRLHGGAGPDTFSIASLAGNPQDEVVDYQDGEMIRTCEVTLPAP
jgi:Ca2+-binding RTX toxin-like protein